MRAYDAAWRAVEAAVTEAGGHAWRFRSADDANVFTEFIEFRAEDPRERPGVSSTMEALDALGPGTTEEWVEPNDRPLDRHAPPDS